MRKSGVLLHISSLPSPWGIGTMGAEARAFVDFLKKAGQSYWQLLPLGPTGYGDSPYQSLCGFAGNPYFIDLDMLAEQGLLSPGEYRNLDWGTNPACADYGLLYENRTRVLRLACGRLLMAPPADYARFCAENEDWLRDYALFMALKNFYGGAPWHCWPEPLKFRAPEALGTFAAEHGAELAFWQAVQYLFYSQWNALRDYAHKNGVQFIGDMPIYVAADSAEIWADPGQFQLDEQLRPVSVAGCPPDGFAAKGQLWGNPLFDWDKMAGDGFSWWKRRVVYQRRIFDLLRIDHFRGIDSYYAIPAGAEDASGGQWRPGPGIALLRELNRAVPQGGFIAEDLGYLTDSVRRLLAESGLPGMKVLQFGFDSREDGDYLPHGYPVHSVVYTGTHDNTTAAGWFADALPEDAARAVEYLALTPAEGYHWGMMRGVWASAGELAVVQMQDILGLGAEARMNVPATAGGNWCWRMLPGSATDVLAQKLHRKMALYARLPEQEKPE